MRKKSKSLIIGICILSMLAFLAYLFEIFNINKIDISQIDIQKSIISYSQLDGKLKFNIFSVKDKKTYAYVVKSDTLHSNDVVTTLSNDNTIFLINSPQENINDFLLCLDKENHQIDLGAKGHIILGDNKDNILLVQYLKNKWIIKKFNKKSLAINKLNFENSIDEFTNVDKGIYISDSNTFVTYYINNKGTFMLTIHDDIIQNKKISDEILTGKVIHHPKTGQIIFLSNQKILKTSSKQSIAYTRLYKVKLLNKNVGIDVIENSEIPNTILSKNDIILDSYSIDKQRIILVISSNGQNSLKSVSLNLNTHKIQEMDDINFSLQSAKLLGDTLFILGQEGIYKINPTGRILKIN